jgi:hypothetical protein
MLRVLPDDAIYFHEALSPALHTREDAEKGALPGTGRPLDGDGRTTGFEDDSKWTLG